MAHYSKQQSFTYDSLMAAKNSLKNFKSTAREHKNGTNLLSEEAKNRYQEDFLNAINDDLNMPVALAVCQKLLKEPKSKDVYALITKFNEVLGLNLDEEQQKDKIPQEIKDMAEKRWQAKKNKDFATADTLRAEITKQGYTINDKKDDYEIVKS